MGLGERQNVVHYIQRISEDYLPKRFASVTVPVTAKVRWEKPKMRVFH